MTQYLVAIHHPGDYDPAGAEDEAMHRDIDALNDEMTAAGVRQARQLRTAPTIPRASQRSRRMVPSYGSSAAKAPYSKVSR